MKSIRRILALALIPGVLTSFFIACGNNPEKSSETGADAGKPDSLALMVDGTFLVKENGESILEEGYEALSGINLVINHPAHNEYSQKVNLAFATGEAPDLILLSSTSYMNYVDNDALYDITELYENSSAKNNVADQGLVDALRVDGKLYGLPFERGNGTITYVRGDWLERLGLRPPTNYAEFVNMLRKFKYNNPEGLPPEKVIPITAAGLVNTEFPLDIYLREFYQDATPDFVQRNGTWVDGMSEPAMVAALTRMRAAYEEKLIDPEIVTNKTSTARDKFYSGVVGVFNYWAGTWNQTLQLNTAANHPQAKVIPLPAIKEAVYLERTPRALAITKGSKNPRAAFKYFLEPMLDNGPYQNLWTFGVEGKTYEIADGEISFLPSLQDPGKPFVKAWFSPEISITTWKPNWHPSELIADSLKLFQKNMKILSLFPSSDTLNKLLPELNSIKSNYVAKIVYGTISVEEGLATYQKQAAKYIETILADLNK